MKMTQYFLGTFKKTSKRIGSVSYDLMLRAGLIRKVSAGIYIWLPTGLRVLRKIENIIRDEMNKIGAIELCLPIVQPAKLWEKSGRLNEYGPELLRFRNRNSQEYVLSPTHEELIAEIINKEFISYRQFPLIVYQIQNKFRDEMRPKFGMFRTREFLMKDGYSFHIDHESLQNTYEIMRKCYNLIFKKVSLNYRVIEADSGNIGGNFSHEFHAIVNCGEDIIACSTNSNYTVNVDLAEAMQQPINTLESEVKENIRLVKITDTKNIENFFKEHNISEKKVVRTFIVRANKSCEFSFLGLLVRYDHELSYAKVKKLPQVALPLSFANEDEIYSLIGANASVLGPINLSIPLVIDRDVAVMDNFIAGANIKNYYFFGINWGRDLALPRIADLRKIVSGDFSSGGNGQLSIQHTIEIGHIFQLGNKYFSSLRSRVQGWNKDILNITMGCYGIGVSRLVAAIVEQNHDENGIIWPDILAPFLLVIIPINMHCSYRVATIAEKIYNEFLKCKIDVLLDDREESLGVKFSDMELIGIPHSIIISDKTLSNEEVEYKHRSNNLKKKINVNDILKFFNTFILKK